MRRPRFPEIVLLVASVTFPLFCAELAARVWLNRFASHDQYLRYALYTDIDSQLLRVRPHQYLDYVLTPNYRAGRTSHNSLGYRGDEFPKTKPPGEFRIVAIGGSTTYDEGVLDNNEIHTKQLEDILRTQYGYEHVRVINAGVPGYNSWESLMNLQFRVLDLSPDLIIHYDNNNDVHARLVPHSKYAGDNSARRKPWTYPSVPWWESSVLLRIVSRYVHHTRQVGIEDFVDVLYPYTPMGYDERIGGDPMDVLDKNPPIYFERNVRNMVTLEKDHGIVPVLVTYAYSTDFANDYTTTRHYQRAFAQHNEVYKRIAAAYGVPLFDLAAIMPQGREYFTDGRHSSAQGARKMAELYAVFLTSHNLLPKRGG